MLPPIAPLPQLNLPAPASGPVENISPSASQGSLVAYVDAIVCLLNAERVSQGRKALIRNAALHRAALLHASEAVRLKWWTPGADPHINPETGSTVGSRIKAQGYCGGANPGWLSEIAYTGAGDGAGTPAGAVNWWMNISKYGHREAILEPRIRELGVGVGKEVADRSATAQARAGTYVVDFGSCPLRLPERPFNEPKRPHSL